MNAQDEYQLVEEPLLRTLAALGWAMHEGDTEVPAFTRRAGFRDVILTEFLTPAIRRLNRDDQGQECLDDAQVGAAVSALMRVPTANLIEANEQATRLLLEGVGVEGADGRRGQTARFIDFDCPERNHFLAVRQFRAEGHRESIIPDVVLFVNGIPLVVIECKSPTCSVETIHFTAARSMMS